MTPFMVDWTVADRFYRRSGRRLECARPAIPIVATTRVNPTTAHESALSDARLRPPLRCGHDCAPSDAPAGGHCRAVAHAGTGHLAPGRARAHGGQGGRSDPP